MIDKNFDVVVIGSGPGGYVSAIRAAQNGRSVGIIERDKIGGICLNWGCIPTKALLKSAELYNSFQKASEFGISFQNLDFDFQKIIQRSRDVSERISKGVEYLMKKNKIEVIRGFGKFLNKNKIEITLDDQLFGSINAKNIIIATGARPRSIPGIQFDGKKIISSTEAMTLKSPPKSMAILGAGPIGIEFAYFYNTFGTKVTVIEMLPSVLPKEDKEITKILESSLKKTGIEILTDSKVESVDISDSVAINISSKDGNKTITAEVALMAVGVQGNVENIGLEKTDVQIERNHIKVDEYGKTSVDTIYAIGDVTGAPWLAHTAMHQGIVAADKIANRAVHPYDRNNVPSCTYCQPQVASIGMTEEDAIKTGHKIKVGRFPFKPIGKAMAIGETEGTVKLIFNEQYGELLGAHIIGYDATEMIAELGLGKTLETTFEEIQHTIHAHPTLSEAIMEAAGQAYNRAIHI